MKELKQCQFQLLKKMGAENYLINKNYLLVYQELAKKLLLLVKQLLILLMELNHKSFKTTNKDIKSSQIGELILKSLRKENEVAYIRYASVYRKFNGVKDFIATLESLKGSSKNQLASIS